MNVIDKLRNKIAKLEGENTKNYSRITVPFGVSAIDQVLPSFGLQSATVNEVIGDKIGVAAQGFCAALLNLFLKSSSFEKKTVLWCYQGDNLYAPGIAPFDLKEEQLLIIQVKKDQDVFWAIEEGLRSGALAAVLGEFQKTNTLMLRRLQLAAEAGNIPAIILRKGICPTLHNPIFTRWKVSALPSLFSEYQSIEFLNKIRWHLELVSCRNGKTGNWKVGWSHGGYKVKSDNKACGFSLVSNFQYGSNYPTSKPSSKAPKKLVPFAKQANRNS